VAQSTASAHIGAAAASARSSAAGLYVCFYYLGGSVGATMLLASPRDQQQLFATSGQFQADCDRALKPQA